MELTGLCIHGLSKGMCKPEEVERAESAKKKKKKKQQGKKKNNA